MQPIDPTALARMIDHTFLKPSGTGGEIQRLCTEAREYGFAMVAINPADVEACSALLRGSGVGVGAAIGFPLGQNTSRVKLFETLDAIERGATEIDMVINVRALQEGRIDVVREEIGALASACRSSGVISKVILETCYLTDSQKRDVCRIAARMRVDFVKTSTGFGPAGATIDDVALLRESVGTDVGVKAAGGVYTLDAAIAMIEAGATRIGTVAGVAIVDEARARRLPTP
jgi:deoxyribose-phosphate aldolase